MRYQRKMRRRDLTGERQPDGYAALPAAACDIAVSEMTGYPLEELCGYIVLTVKHRPDGKHELGIMPSHKDEWAWALEWLERATEDVRSIL